MLAGKSASDLAMIARNGGGFIIDGAKYSASDLAMIGRNMNERACVQIENSGRFSTSDLAMIGRNAAGQVIFA